MQFVVVQPDEPVCTLFDAECTCSVLVLMQEADRYGKEELHAERIHGKDSKEWHAVAQDLATSLEMLALLWHTEVTLKTPTDAQDAVGIWRALGVKIVRLVPRLS